jgi:hypothetical protein
MRRQEAAAYAAVETERQVLAGEEGPMSNEFLAWFMGATEDKWRRTSINPPIYGFQFVRGTRWNPGLPEEAIREYEKALAVRFPNVLEHLFGQ